MYQALLTRVSRKVSTDLRRMSSTRAGEVTESSSSELEEDVSLFYSPPGGKQIKI